jgi:two-component system NtrC family sensor kinase
MGLIAGTAAFAGFAEERAARERLEVLLEFAPAFIISVASDGTIEFINRTLPQHDKKDVIGSSWLEYFPPERHAAMTAALRAALETGQTQTYEIATAGPDGADIWFESQLAPIRVAGEVVGGVLVSQDITERKRAQAELLAGRQLALLGTLAAGVAHEINTPVQFVGDSMRFLREAMHDLLLLFEKVQALRHAALAGTPLEQTAREATEAEESADLAYLRENVPKAFERCTDGLDRVATIVRSLKDFAHPAEQEMSAADLNQVVQGTLAIAANEYKYVAELETDFGELPPVTCHSGEIGQAVLNILVNAAHAVGDAVSGTGQKGVIAVRTRREGDTALIAITDTGGGIPDGIKSRIFDPFFTTKPVGKGTGQGLAIASSTVRERHGGELTFETTQGRGTTFFIRIPIARDPKRASPGA